MPLGIANTFLLQTANGAYDLRHVVQVTDHPTNVNLVLAVFDTAPQQSVAFDRASFEPLYAAALVAQATGGGGGGGGGGVTDGDKGDIVVAGGGSMWTIDRKGLSNGIATLDGTAKVPLAQLPAGTASGIATLDGTAKVPLAQLPAGTASGLATLDGAGKIPTAQLPPLAITDVFVVANQAAMLALSAEAGDIAVRTDTNTSFVLQAAPASTLGNWVLLRSPTDAVTSVNGQTGTVALTATDVGAVATGAVGAANGVASLDGTGKVPSAQLPSAPVTSVNSQAGAVVLSATDVGAVPATADGKTGRASLRIDQRTTVADADYPALNTDHLITYTSITAPRVVTLPSGSAFQIGQEVVVNDESGGVSGTNTITVAASGGELIDGAATEVISGAYDMRRFFRTAAGWTFDKGVVRTSRNLSDMTDVVAARANLGIRNAGQKRDLLRGFSFVEPFTGSVLAGGLGVISSGTGAGTSSGLAPSGGAWGTLICGTGTTATGRCSINSTASASAVNQTIYGGAGAILAGSRLRIATLSDGTETFVFRGSGVSDSANGDGVDAIFFRYTHTENGGNWTCVSRSNSTETAIDSTVPVVANQYYWLEISVNAAGNSVDFLIDGVLRATIATNVPNGTARAFGLLSGQIVKSVGATARTFEIDDYYFDCTFTTPRT